MNPRLRPLALLTLVLAGQVLVSCVSTSGPQITKVNPYHLKPGQVILTEDQMIQTEQLRRLHGAVTAEEFVERFGNYYTVFWHAPQGGADELKLEYLQGNTGSTVHTQVIDIRGKKGRNTSEFRVTGEAYTTGGPVTAWKTTLISGGTPVAESKSFLWK